MGHPSQAGSGPLNITNTNVQKWKEGVLGPQPGSEEGKQG